jgi:uncharacterized protein YjbJ (UPF0337 family)
VAAPRIVRGPNDTAIGQSSTPPALGLARGVRSGLPSAGSLPASVNREEMAMDSDRIGGPVKEAQGKVKEELGDLTDDPTTEAEGKMDQASGKLQNEWGETKDEVRDAINDEDDAR